MADTTALKNRIRAAIKSNDNQEITGPVLQQILLDIVDELDLYPELQNETNARQQADTQLQNNINSEANARSTADSQLQNAINAIHTQIDNGYVYAGIATPSTSPATGKVFYIAVQAGTYTNFGSTVVTEGITILRYVGSEWVKEQLIYADGGVFNITAYNGGTTYTDLASALGTNGANVPVAVRKSGMSVKYVRTSDNKYVQYRLISDEWSINTENWAIADESVYVENPEFVYVKTDKDDKILWAIKTDGGIYYGAGVPQQVIDYIEEKISSLSLDEYEDIVAFLSDYLGSDTTLKVMIDGINERIPELIENPEYIQATTDSEDNILEGITAKGFKQINIPIDTPSATIKHIENPEWSEVVVDKNNRILFGIKKKNDNIEAYSVIFKYISSGNIKADYIEADNVKFNKYGIISIADGINKNIATDIKKLYPKETTGVVLKNLKFGKHQWGIGQYVDWENHVIDHPIYTPLSLIWFSDVHENGDNIQRIKDFYDEHNEYIDDVLFTGDLMLSSYRSDLVSVWPNSGASKFLFVLGNHDACITLSPFTPYSPKIAYNEFISPYKNLTEINYIENKMYWYKDYLEAKSPECPNGIRLIALDQYHWKEREVIGDYVPSTYEDGTSVDTGEQLAWFVSQLTYCKENGKAVVIALHGPNNDCTGILSSFDTPDAEKITTASYSEIQTDMFEAVQDFISDGGEFICWLTGHMHQDWFTYATNYPNQLVLSIDTASFTMQDRSTFMVEGTKSMDRFNIISFDSWRKYIRLFRIGIDFDRHGRHIGSLVYDYKNKQLISNY